MDKQTVVILQDDQQSVLSVVELLKIAADKFNVVGIATSGQEGVKIIKETLPDFVITEIVLSDLDGFKVIEEITKLSKRIKIVVLSAVGKTEIVAKAMSLGADYYLKKPILGEVLIERLTELIKVKSSEVPQNVNTSTHGEFRRNTIDERISNIFINVGIPPHIKGYSYLREGVKMAVDNPDIINNITKKLYPMIGQKYDTTASKVERAIRHAIEVAWNRGRIETINSILGVRAYVGAEKPTNGEFIALIADKMLLERVQ